MSIPAPPLPVVVLISGRGSNMRALVEHGRDPALGYRVAAVLCDQPDAQGLEVARSLGVPARALPAPPRGCAPGELAAYEAALAAAIEAHHPALVALAGFMRVLSGGFVARFEGRLLNIHPSLLPRHPGLDTHRRVLEAHETEHGATVHFVTARLDAGPPVIQAKLEVEPGEGPRHLAERVNRLEHCIYPLAVAWFCTGRLRQIDGAAWLDGRRLAGPVLYDAHADRSSSRGH